MSRNANKYRKIWMAHHNMAIPEGYDIHHKDGNKRNNSPENLQAVSLAEHLDIHEQQGDWGAVQAILMRMSHDTSTIKKAASLAQRGRWSSGKHNFQKITPEERRILSRKGAMVTVANKTGIHAINASPTLAKENGRRGGLKAKENNAGFLNTNSDKHGSKHVKNTKWWTHSSGSRKRCVESPGEDWYTGMVKKDKL